MDHRLVAAVIGWLDASAGASGDMLLGALVDAGVPLAAITDAVDALGLGIRFEVSRVERGGLGATYVDVLTHDDQVSRSWRDVQQLVSGTAYEVFARLAAAEGRIHGVPVEDVHFHEVGAHDALADVVGAAAGFAYLGLSALHCSTVSLGSGTTRGAHGPLPVPAPAVLALLEGAPVQAGLAPYEMTTPTGAALLATLVTDWGPLPAMRPTATGHGAGTRDPQEVANVLRLTVGEPLEQGTAAVLLEANVDDLDPRLWPHVLDQLLAAGASDAWLTPILMKKGRLAHTLSVLCSTSDAARLRHQVFLETSTIGLRQTSVDKHPLERTESTVYVEGQPIRVKTAWLDGRPVNANPEWADVAAAAAQLGRPAKQVLEEARRHLP
ncbi:MAG: nickel pincer cofactor biosynthesis protein LarC [Mycobacteriales bacterium]